MKVLYNFNFITLMLNGAYIVSHTNQTTTLCRSMSAFNIIWMYIVLNFLDEHLVTKQC